PPTQIYTLSLHDALPIWDTALSVAGAPLGHYPAMVALARSQKTLAAMAKFRPRLPPTPSQMMPKEAMPMTSPFALNSGPPELPRSEEHTSELQSRENLVC